jgi:hypothetical protein
MQLEKPFEKWGTIHGKKEGQIPEDLNLQPHRFESLKHNKSAIIFLGKTVQNFFHQIKHLNDS